MKLVFAPSLTPTGVWRWIWVLHLAESFQNAITCKLCLLYTETSWGSRPATEESATSLLRIRTCARLVALDLAHSCIHLTVIARVVVADRSDGRRVRAASTTCPAGRTPSCATPSTRRATSSCWRHAAKSSTAVLRYCTSHTDSVLCGAAGGHVRKNSTAISRYYTGKETIGEVMCCTVSNNHECAAKNSIAVSRSHSNT